MGNIRNIMVSYTYFLNHSIPSVAITNIRYA